MSKLSKDLSVGTLHPRENLRAAGTLAAVNAELFVDSDGCSTVTIDLRGTFNLTVELSGTVDGTNWVLIPVRSMLGGALTAFTSATSGAWTANCAGFQRIRARVATYTSGGANAVMIASTALLNETFGSQVSTLAATATAAAGTAVTLTLPSPGAGLRQYVTALRIRRFAATTLTAAATPILITTTNLPGSPVFTVGAEALAQGVCNQEVIEDFAFPLMSASQNVATTFVCPATPNVIWRASAWYNVAP